MRIMLAIVIPLVSSVVARAGEPDLRPAIERGLRRVETGAARYLEHRNCFSCHHQITAGVLEDARARGFKIDETTLFMQVEFTRETFRPKLDRIRRGQAIPGANTMAAYALAVLEASRYSPDETTAGLVEFLVERQHADGSWPALADRPPSEGSPFTNAALALRALRVYGLDDPDLAPALHARIRKTWQQGRDWLVTHEPKTTEDRAFHLRGLAAAEADPARIAVARANLIKEQRPDGGWAQLASLSSDAYATGIVLGALREAGLPISDEVHRRGIEFLLKSQQPDGGWLVTTRSRPVQTFFDNGDPGGKSQFISFLATNHALIALLATQPRR